MFRRTSLPAIASLVLIGLVGGCSSKPAENVAVADTAPPEDTAPVEDTAPWLNYPEGPYGLNKGNTFPPLELKGYRNGLEGKAAGEWVDLKMHDYYDPTGERGVHAILVVVSAEWCNPCRIEANELPRFYTEQYGPRGAKFITTMIEDSRSNPADQKTVDRWVSAFNTNFDIAADPDALTFEGKTSIPINYIVNPRDMKIYRINTGAVGEEATRISGLTVLLDYNGAPAAPAPTTP